MANISHFYDAQIRRYIVQFVRMMSNFQYLTGKDGDNSTDLIKVPVRYGDINRQVANILRQGSENALVSVPQMAAYITNLTYNRDRVLEPTHISKIHVRERGYNSETKTYDNTQGNQHTIERIMPVPFDLTMNCDLFSNNTDQKLQILEQLLVLFNPALELQTTDNWIDWTSLSYVELTDITFSSRTIPQGTDDEIDVASLQFTVPIWLTPPAKIKKLGVIEKIIASVYNEDASAVDVSGIIGSDLLSRQEITFGNYGLYVDGNRARLLQSRDTLTESSGGDEAHVSPTRETAKTDTQLVYGREIPWAKVLGVYGKITAGLSKIKLETAITTANNEDTITYVTGTIAEHPTEAHQLLFTVDADSIPTDSVPQFTKIIDPTQTKPTGSEVNGQRYLITQPIGTSLHDIKINKIEHDGTVTATVTCDLAHGLAVGDTVRITGADPAYYNGTIGVSTVPSTTTFTYKTVIPTSAAASSSVPTADTDKTTAAGGIYVDITNVVSPAIGSVGLGSTIVGQTNRGPSAWGNLVASESDIIQYNSDTDKWNVDFDSSNVSNVQYATNNTSGIQFKWTGTQWQKSWEGEYAPGDWVLDL